MCVLMSVCTGERATAPAWVGEHEFLWFWCHVCLFARAYLRISSCPLRSGRSCVRLSLVLLCAHVFCPLAVYLYPRGDIYSVFLAQAALTQALLKTGRLFLLPGRRRAVQSPAVPAECLSPAPPGGGFQDAELCSFGRGGIDTLPLLPRRFALWRPSPSSLFFALTVRNVWPRRRYRLAFVLIPACV